MSEICREDVYRGYHSHKCGKPAKFEVNGHHYCGIHNPMKAPTKAQIEAIENYEKQKAKWRIERAAPDLLEALKLLLDREWQDDEGDRTLEDARAAARSAIAKATNVEK